MHARIRQVVGAVEAISAPRASTFGEPAGRAVELIASESASEPAPEPASSQAATGAGWLWLLHDDSAAAPQALAHLLDAARRSPSVGVAGPKLLIWHDPSRLLEVGSVITRTGRRVGGPATGEPDQGQHDHRSDMLGVSSSGMLIRLDVFETLGGFDPAFGPFRDDLDLCWRAQLAGHRVVIAPRARMREAAASTSGQRSPDLSAETARRRDRRHGRQVVLARCSPYAAPFLVIWIALASLTSAAVLLLAKRPQGAWTALGDFAALLTPWRLIAARWRFRGSRRVRRRDLRGLFASPKAGFANTLDTIHETVPAGSARAVEDRAAHPRSLESGLASEDTESLDQAVHGVAWRILRHPGFLAVMVGAVLAAMTWRSLLGALAPSGLGVVGGELLPVSSNASELWHAWLDGWHGPGLGNAVESAPYLPVLSGEAWVLEHLPLIGASTPSVGVDRLASGGGHPPFCVDCLPRGPRRDSGTLAQGVGGAGLGVTGHTDYGCRRGTPWRRRGAHPAAICCGRVLLCREAFCKELGHLRCRARAWVTGAFNPALGALGALAAFVLLVVGHGRTRLHAAVLLLVPLGLLGPWILQVVEHPLLLLTGPGLTVWQGSAAAPWQLELLHPGGPGSYPVLASAPIAVAGVIAMSRRGVDSRMMTVLAVLTMTGLALGVAFTARHHRPDPAGPAWSGPCDHHVGRCRARPCGPGVDRGCASRFRQWLGTAVAAPIRLAPDPGSHSCRGSSSGTRRQHGDPRVGRGQRGVDPPGA